MEQQFSENDKSGKKENVDMNANQNENETSENEEDIESKSGKEEEPSTEESLASKEKEAFKLMSEKNYSDASDLFSQVLEYKESKLGSLDDSLAPLFFAYGKCIVHTTRTELDNWGGMMKNTLKKQLLNAEDAEDEEGSDEEAPLNPNQLQQQVNEGFELAWNVLEVARVIYSKDPTKRAELGEVYIWLGDVCMESDTLTEAVENYRQCLAIRELIYPPNDKRLADVHFFIGLALQLEGKTEPALKHFETAKNIFDVCLETARKEKNADEVGKLEPIVQELVEKLEELKSPVHVTELLKKELPVETVGFGKPTSESLPVIDLGSFKKNSTVAKTTATTSNATTTIREKETEPQVHVLNVKRKIDQVYTSEAEQNAVKTN